MRNTTNKILSGLIIVMAYLTASTISQSESFKNLNVMYIEKMAYISMVDLAETFRVNLSYDPAMMSMTAQRGENKITLSHLSRIAVMNGESKNIMLPARMMRGAVYAPAVTFLPIFSEMIPGTLEWDRRIKAVKSSGITSSVTGVSYENYKNGSLIKIALSEPLQHTVKLADNKNLTVDLADGSMAQESIPETSRPDFIGDLNIIQQNKSVLLAFDMKEDIESYKVEPSENPLELMISLRTKSDRVSTPYPNGDNSLSFVEPDPNLQLMFIDTVIIDAGHGGKDPGAVGPKKTKEKDIVLSVAKELKSIIDKRGEVKAIMTRDKDVFVPLHQRAKIARDNRGKLFVSIHANASRKRAAKGMEVYFLSIAKTADAQTVADRENRSIELEENSKDNYVQMTEGNEFSQNLFDIEMEMLSNVYLHESQTMCSILLDKSVAATKFQRRGVKQAPFYVMVGTQALMPSVLFEIGFISNAGEEKMLKRSSYQKRLAEAIYESIITFKKEVERGLITGG